MDTPLSFMQSILRLVNICKKCVQWHAYVTSDQRQVLISPPLSIILEIWRQHVLPLGWHFIHCWYCMLWTLQSLLKKKKKTPTLLSVLWLFDFSVVTSWYTEHFMNYVLHFRPPTHPLHQIIAQKKIIYCIVLVEKINTQTIKNSKFQVAPNNHKGVTPATSNSHTFLIYTYNYNNLGKSRI